MCVRTELQFLQESLQHKLSSLKVQIEKIILFEIKTEEVIY